MAWLIYTFISLAVLFFLIANYTMLLHPRARHHAKTEDYACMEDVWQKKPGNKKLLILLHGMYSNPDIFRFIAESLKDSPWDVYMPALPACSKTFEDLKRCGPWTWNESLAAALKKVKSQENKYETIVLGGHSQGGALTLAIGPKLPFLKALVDIAGPVKLYHSRLKFIHNIGIGISGFLHFFAPKGVKLHYIDTPERRDVEDVSGIEGLIYPLTLHTFKRGLADVRAHLKDIRIPIFLAYEKGDQLVDFANYEYIRAHISSDFIYDKIFAVPKQEEPYGNRHLLPVYKPVKNELIISLKEFLAEL